MKPIRVVFAGGGTGGHVYPAIAMYEGLLARGGTVEALFVGVKGGMESQLLAKRNVRLVLLPGRGVRGASLWGKLMAPLELARGVFAAVGVLRAFRPDVVVGTGGYASVSAVLAAVILRRPRILQEQNSVPGLANRLLARFADVMLLSYEESRSRLPRGVRTVVIGNPLRIAPGKAREAREAREAGARALGLDPSRHTVLVIGGSRGAHSLNVAASSAVERLLGETGLQWILLTGERDCDEMRGRFAPHGDRVVVRAYLEDVQHAYGVADVAVARAGASAVFELAAFGIPSIFVPYPYAADGHQRLNVEPLRRQGGAVVIEDVNLSGERLAEEITALLRDGPRRERMSRVLTGWARVDAAESAAEKIVELCARSRQKGRRRDLREGVA